MPQLLYGITTKVVQALLVHVQQSLQISQARGICSCCCWCIQRSMILPVCGEALSQVCMAGSWLLCMLGCPADTQRAQLCIRRGSKGLLSKVTKKYRRGCWRSAAAELSAERWRT